VANKCGFKFRPFIVYSFDGTRNQTERRTVLILTSTVPLLWIRDEELFREAHR
jgi:hypothetical protein